MFTTELEIMKHWNSITIKSDNNSVTHHEWISTIVTADKSASRVIIYFAKPEDIVPFAESLLEQAKDALKQPKEVS